MPLVIELRAVQRVYESGDTSVHAVRLGERQYEAELDRYKAGVSTSRAVLEAQADLENARVAHLQARLDLLAARSALQRLEGSALTRYGVTLPTPRDR
jgi:outer membrane protein TolC